MFAERVPSSPRTALRRMSEGHYKIPLRLRQRPPLSFVSHDHEAGCPYPLVQSFLLLNQCQPLYLPSLMSCLTWQSADAVSAPLTFELGPTEAGPQYLRSFVELLSQDVAFQRPDFVSGLSASDLAPQFGVEVFWAGTCAFTCNSEAVFEFQDAYGYGRSGEYMVVLSGNNGVNPLWRNARRGQSFLLDFLFNLIVIHKGFSLTIWPDLSRPA